MVFKAACWLDFEIERQTCKRKKQCFNVVLQLTKCYILLTGVTNKLRNPEIASVYDVTALILWVFGVGVGNGEIG